ncbi:PREDICTED: mucin-2-like [Cyprinodon variegatus]|uniref:mucin-2-like n=1 Tax=Cyprinodon variegatus TaxID=28743 RepID=UPI000742627B|nr:PREDICTED: mucin-2-like [Cyprinodon variegatus]
MVDGASTVYAVQETVTAQTALRDNKVQKNHTNDGATPGPFLGRHTKLKAATEIQEFLQLQTKNEHSNFPTNSTLWINHIVTRRKTLTLGFPPSITKKTPGLPLITDPFSHSTSPFPLLDTRYTVTSTNYPLTKFSSLNRHGPVSPHKDVSTKSMDLNIKSQEQNPGRNTTMTPNTTLGQPTEDFYSTYTPKPEYQILKEQGKNKSAKPETSGSAEKVTNNHTTSQMNRIKTEVTPPSYQASSFKSLFQTVESNVDLKTQIDTSHTLMGAKSTPKQTNSPLTTTTHIHQAVHVTETPQSIPLQEEKTQTDTSTESYRPSFQPQGVYSQSLLTTQLFAVSRGENNLKSQGNAKRMTQVDGLVPSNSQSSFTTIDYPVNSTSSDSSHNTSVVPLGENFTLHQSGGSVTSLKHPSVTSKSSYHSIAPHSMNKAKTIPAHSVPPSPFPISVPPHLTARQYYTSPQPTFPTPSVLSSFSATNHPSTTSLPTTTFPQCITTSRFSTSSTRSQASSSFSYNSVPTLSPLPFSVTPPSISPPLKSSSSYFTSTITSPYPEPTSATPLFRNTPFPSPVPRKTTVNERLLTGPHHQFSKTHFTSLAQRKLVHPNPKPYPNLRPNPGQEIHPNILKIQPKRPSDPSETPDMDGKYPDIIPRHRAWEIGMLLGCSAGLGMVLVVGIRYVYRKACGRRTEVTLNDREREYGRGGHGLIQLQECGDLVRVRKIRENSFVLLAEYDILPSATN